MERQVSISRTSELSYDAVVEQLKTDSSRALRAPVGGDPDTAAGSVVHLHTRWSRFNRDETVTARIGHYESVRTGHGRVNLSWEAGQHKRLLPTVNGRLEVDQMATGVTEFRYVGQYQAAGGLRGVLQGLVAGPGVVDDAVGQLLDEIIAHLGQHHASGTNRT